MAFKVFAGIVAVALLVAFISPVVLKVQNVALTVVVLIGLTMMVVDVWQSIREKGD